MRIRVGYDMTFNCLQPTPMILTLSIHESRIRDIVIPDLVRTDPPVDVHVYRDGFRNQCMRLVAPAGRIRISAKAYVNDTGEKDVVVPSAEQIPVEHLPDETLEYLLGSRYCETELLFNFAWQQFGGTPPGWARVQAICDFVHNHIKFGYNHARNTRTAFEAFNEARGVCRDYAHLGVTLCRCMNIPARYCAGYLGDIGVAPSPDPMDFAGWFEAFLGGNWYTFDPRNNIPRIGRVLIARGRDAADCAISCNFGLTTLEAFQVWTDEGDIDDMPF